MDEKVMKFALALEMSGRKELAAEVYRKYVASFAVTGGVDVLQFFYGDAALDIDTAADALKFSVIARTAGQLWIRLGSVLLNRSQTTPPELSRFLTALAAKGAGDGYNFREIYEYLADGTADVCASAPVEQMTFKDMCRGVRDGEIKLVKSAEAGGKRERRKWVAVNGV